MKTLLWCHRFYRNVPVNHVQNIHQLSFVLVDSLHLDVKHALNVQFNLTFTPDPVSEFHFVLFLDCSPLVLEFLIINELLQSPQFPHVQDPFVGFKVLSVQICQPGIGAQHPSSGRNSISLVDKFVWEDLMEVLEQVLLE